MPDEITADEIQKLAALGDDPNFRAAGPAKKLSDATKLRETVKPAGGRLAIPPFELLDRVVRVPDGDVMVKAYIFQELGDVMRARGPGWGLHFCPEFSTRLNELDSIFGDARILSGDWNKPLLRKKWQSRLVRFFAAIADSRPFLEIANASRERVVTVAAKGLALAGYIDGSNEPRLKAHGKEKSVAWAFSAKNAQLVPVEFVSGVLQTADPRSLRKWSPILGIPVEIQRPEIRQAQR